MHFQEKSPPHGRFLQKFTEQLQMSPPSRRWEAERLWFVERSALRGMCLVDWLALIQFFSRVSSCVLSLSQQSLKQ